MLLIKDKRTERGLTQTQLAARAGTTPATISRLESGVRTPTLGMLNALAEALECSMRDLISDPSQHPPPERSEGSESGLLSPPE